MFDNIEYYKGSIEDWVLEDDQLYWLLYEAINEYKECVADLLSSETENDLITDLGNWCYNILDSYICYPDYEETYRVIQKNGDWKYVVESFWDRTRFNFEWNRVTEIR